MSDSTGDNRFKSNDLNLELMSTEELEELIRLDARSPYGDTSDDGFIFRVLEVMEQREQEHPTGTIPEIDRAWASFQKNYLPTAGDGRSLYEDGENELPPADPAGTSGRKQAYPMRRNRRLCRIILAAVVFVIFCGSLAAQAAGIDLFGVVARWTSETFHFEFTAQTPSGQTDAEPSPSDAAEAYASLGEALDAYGITEPVVPTRYPPGFTLVELKVSPMPKAVIFQAAYQSGDQFMAVSVRQFESAEDAGSVTFEKDDTPVIAYERGGVTHYVMSNYDQTTAAWTDRNLLCSIHGDLSVDEMEDMIDSIYER